MITIFYIGCGTGSTDNNFKLFLYKLFTTQYFWADKVSRHVTYYKYHTPQEMIDGLKYKQKDRWSMVTTKEQNENFLNQKSIGFGFSYSKLEDNSSIVVFVRINSPADKAGLKRGDILLKVDDKNLTIENIKEATLNIDKKSKFLIYRPTLDKNLTINILAQEYSFKVTKAILLRDNIGYMRLDSFTSKATEEIDSAFDFFKSQDITNLIIDVRYNSGGSIVTASILLDKLMRNVDNEVQFKLTWNKEYYAKNQIGRFETDSNSLDLDKIIFLTTGVTASASELVINALKPYKGDDIIIVGSKTHGKPVGMEGRTDGKYIYYLVNFVIANRDNFYDYFNGLDVTDGCFAPDDLTHQLGDSNESMLKKALFYIDNGQC
jgi:C-terminal processing protease CtpA/Prc